MDNYFFNSKKSEIFSSYFRDFHKAFCDEAHIRDSDLGHVMDEVKGKYAKQLHDLYTEYGIEYNEKTFDEEYQKSKNQ